MGQSRRPIRSAARLRTGRRASRRRPAHFRAAAPCWVRPRSRRLPRRAPPQTAMGSRRGHAQRGARTHGGGGPALLARIRGGVWASRPYPTAMAGTHSGPGDAGAADPRGFLVSVGEIDRVHFLDWGPPAGAAGAAGVSGSQPPVLLIHGLAGTAWTWAPVARRLRDRYHVVAQDLRGHGLSDAPTWGYGPEELAEDALVVAEGAGLLEAVPPLVVAGHGFGAIVAA